MSRWTSELQQADDVRYVKDGGTRSVPFRPRRVSLVGFAGFCALLLILGAVLYGIGGTVYQSDTQDTYSTKIVCSNGNVYDATEANLALAIADIGKDGTIWIGSDLTLTTPIVLTSRQGIILDFQMNNVTLGATVGFVSVTNSIYCMVRNVFVKIPANHIGDIILLTCGTSYLRYNTFENIRINDATTIDQTQRHNSTGIHLLIPNTATSSIWGNTFKDISMTHIKNGILLECHDVASWGNGNLFDNIIMNGFVVGVNFTVDTISTWGFGGNTFTDLQLQANHETTYGLKNVSGDDNVFKNLQIIDWSLCDSPHYQILLNTTADYTSISAGNLDMSYIYDQGDYTQITHDRGHYYDMSPYNYIIYKQGAYYCAQNGNNGTVATKSTDALTLFNAVFFTANINSVFIKSGTYYLTGAISGAGLNKISLVGEDEHTTILKSSGGTGLFLLSDAASRINITIRNICFDGNNTGSGAAIKGIKISSSATGMDNLLIDNCIFQNFNKDSSSEAICDVSPTSDYQRNVQIINCKFYNNYYAVHLVGDADPSRVVFCDISNNYMANNSYNIYLTYANNCTITNNRILGITYGIYLEYTFNCNIMGNIIKTVGGIYETNTCGFNMYLGNNCIACTTDYNIDSTTYKPYPSGNFSMLNFGTWT
jgi:parallel beta-helix repeat protein